MTTLRSVTTLGLAAVVASSIGCHTTGGFGKRNRCTSCDQGAVYYSTPSQGSVPPQGGMLPPPAPVMTPQPVPESQALPPVPPPPTGFRPSPLQQMRASTTEFFLNTGSNVRGMFTRRGEPVEQATLGEPASR